MDIPSGKNDPPASPAPQQYIDLNDNGIRSRKLWVTVSTQLIVVAMALASVKWVGLTATYATMVGGLVSILAIFISGNVVNTHLTTQNWLKKIGMGPKDDPDAS